MNCLLALPLLLAASSTHGAEPPLPPCEGRHAVEAASLEAQAANYAAGSGSHSSSSVPGCTSESAKLYPYQDLLEDQAKSYTRNGRVRGSNPGEVAPPAANP